MEQKMAYNLTDFLQIVAKLRDPNGGCPWDLKQNFRSMIPHLLEESYEVVEAIENKDIANLKEELGDLLLQVAFLSQLAHEEKWFNFDDVVNDVSEKLIRRHPHVFGDAQAGDEQEALARWNEIKAIEKEKAEDHSILADIPQSFPALMRAEKIQKKCANHGFDWDNIDDVFTKVEEELGEVKAELSQMPVDQTKAVEEVGDLLFATVNLVRHLKAPAENTLRQANDKFERRFRRLEQLLDKRGKTLPDCNLMEMEVLWNTVKDEEKTENKNSQK